MTHLTAQPDRIQPLFHAAPRCLYERARISLNHAKTRVWNAAAVEPPGLADISTADVWREAEQWITVLGAPLGGNAFVLAQLDAVRNKQLRLLQVLPTLPDLQVAWLLLLYCALPRSNYALRIIPPELTDLFAIEHDAAVQRCFSAMLPDTASRQSQLAFRRGGLGLRSARLHHPRRFGPRGLTACRRSSAEIPTSRNILCANLSRMCLVAVSWTRSRHPTMRRNHMMLRTMPLASGGGGRKQRRQLLTCKVRLPTATTWTQPLQPCCCPSPDRAQPRPS